MSRPAVRQPVTDWIGDAEISSTPKHVSMVASSRMPAEWTDEIMAEVARRGLTPIAADQGPGA